ncbi:SdrD B-like domain-containing protein [Pseudactinotalea sp. HY158]|uniref:SdrD B-like domain-containing protein n=1 Tax=Pseudactinotalea sp. HY158 TaxID=2654547 RepID=UPI00129CB106|nr:SdrD B-like domain-containing protein [Pseudactinotalea sp. HY158]QGH70117.1 LPXTG cell wall anchor domain-containing protein [Pseudactinotalea sp. HY158]
MSISFAAGRRRQGVRRAIALGLSLVLALATVIGLSQVARAATPGINSAEVLLNGATYDGTAVVQEGDTLTLRVQYTDAMTPGATVTFGLGTNVTLTGVPAGNEAVETFATDGNNVQVTFKDPWPAGVNQGVFDLTFTVNTVDESGHDKLTWTVDGEEQSIDVIVKNEGDNFANVTDGSAKALNTGDLNQYVTVSDEGVVSLKPGIADHVFTYTLTLNSAEARTGFGISDVLPATMDYVPGSFAGKLTTWDANGLNQTTGDFTFAPTVTPSTDGTSASFAGAVDVPGPSILTVTYKAQVTDIDGLTALVQEAYDAREGAPGNYSVELKNTATFGDTDRTASKRIGGNIAAPPSPEPGNAFGKSADWNKQTFSPEAVAEDGTFATPVDIAYTLKADLTKLQGKSDFELSRNVVIRDELPTQLTWNTTATDFITASAGFTLTEASDCPDASTFAGDAYVGQYCVDGQTLLINVGQDDSTNVTFAVKAQLTTTAGLDSVGNQTSVQGATSYKFRNVASFYWDAGDKPHNAGWDAFPTILPETDEGYNDPDAFSKTGHVSDTTIRPGETVTATYKFVAAAGKGIDAASSRIVDYVDTEIFDLSDLSTIDVSGSYDSQNLDGANFELSTDADGNLVIELSEAGKAFVADRGTDKRYEVDITLTSKPFEGKETKTITNKATLFGEGDDPLYWSETETEATSYGDEAEVRKRVYDRDASEWVATLDAQIGVDGTLVQDTYVYRVEFIPHGSYNQVVIADVDDVLPDATEFLGFVTEANAATGENPTAGPVDIGGNLDALFADGVVTLQQRAGTKLQAGAPIAAYFAVKITDNTAPIVNKIGSTEATITPLDPPSVDIEKWTSEDGSDGPAYDESGALTNDGYAGDFDEGSSKSLTHGTDQEIAFTVSNDGGETLVDVVVSDELTSGAGAIENLVCTFPDESTGTTWEGPFEPAAQFECTGTLPGLNAGETHSDTATVTAVGNTSEDEVTDSDDWNGHVESYAVGDYTWIDTNRDGVQDGDEPVLPGVTVELLDESGAVIDTTTTDDQGRYLFDNLPAGTYQVKFTLTDEQAAIYQFTQAGAGEDDAADSDADVTTGLTATFVLDDSNEALTNDYTDQEFGATQGVDPTWDAGVNLKSVSVGDYVWVDSDRDGLQDEGEPGIPGVTVCLVGPDGEPVTDVFGDVVEPVVTGPNGEYTFENLPALTGDDVYTVCIDRDASAEALEPYVPTTPGAGDDRGVDSSTWEASSEPGGLSQDGDRDPTLDFGFVVKSYAIGDYVWIDSNRDGIQDDGEQVLPGVTVELTNADGEPVTDVFGELVEPTTTDAEGRYLFDNLPAGTYQVQFTLTDEQALVYQFTQLDAGEDDAADSDADVTTGLTATFVLDGSNEALTTDYDREFGATQGVDPTWDAGVNLKSVSVGDYVWVDENRDGLQDEGEPGIPGVTVCLVGPDGEPVTDVFGEPVGPVVTDENGHYTFDDLPALTGDDVYTVCIDRDASAEALEPYVPTTLGAGDDRGVDSSTWEASSEPGGLSQDGDRDPSLDFGFVVKSYAVGDYVWIDSDKDGVQGEGEQVLPGVTVELTDADGEPVTDVYGTVVAPTTTDDQGRYLFDNLPAGTYQVKFTLTAEQAAVYQLTQQGAGDNAGLDSDADPATGWTVTFTLDDANEALTSDYDREFGATQGVDPTWDAGVFLTPVPGETPSETPSAEAPAPGPMPDTGSSAPVGAIVAALALLGLGGVLLTNRRRQLS